MALDEAMLSAVARLGQPILRFYGWSEPAATFGFFQHYEQVAGWTQVRPLLRRPTGGGLVSHLDDWTYSLVIPPAHPWYQWRAAQSYRYLHQWIQAAFATLGLVAELNPIARLAAPGQCFVGAEQFDVLCQGRKIAGAAQRRTRHGLLIQGSVQYPGTQITRGLWQQAVCASAQAGLGVEWTSWEIDSALRELAENLVRQKYSQSEYNQRR